MLLAILEEKNCVVCINILLLDRSKDHDTARTKSCKYFILNVEEKNKCLKEIQENKTYSITELENLI